jgi:hypothetical protein
MLEREDGATYLETTFIANLLFGDATDSLKERDEESFRLNKTLTYLDNEMVQPDLYKFFIRFSLHTQI